MLEMLFKQCPGFKEVRPAKDGIAFVEYDSVQEVNGLTESSLVIPSILVPLPPHTRTPHTFGTPCLMRNDDKPYVKIISEGCENPNRGDNYPYYSERNQTKTNVPPPGVLSRLPTCAPPADRSPRRFIPPLSGDGRQGGAPGVPGGHVTCHVHHLRKEVKTRTALVCAGLTIPCSTQTATPTPKAPPTGGGTGAPFPPPPRGFGVGVCEMDRAELATQRRVGGGGGEEEEGERKQPTQHQRDCCGSVAEEQFSFSFGVGHPAPSTRPRISTQGSNPKTLFQD